VKRWEDSKYQYRFPGGESQKDLALQLYPLILELERQTDPVIVISHLSTLQVLYGYFLGSEYSVDRYYNLNIPQHCVIQLIPHQYGWEETRYHYVEEGPDEKDDEEDDEDTTFEKPSKKKIRQS